MLKKIPAYIVYGVAWGWMFFVVVCLFMDAFAPAAFASIVENFPMQALGSALVGMGFGTSAIVYQSEKLWFWQQVLVHFGVGMGVYFPVALWLRWIPLGSAGYVALYVAIAVATFAFIWTGFYLYHRAEAKRMNEKLKGLAQEDACKDAE